MIKLKTSITMSRIAVTLLLLTGVANAKEAIVHDAEYAIIEAQKVKRGLLMIRRSTKSWLISARKTVISHQTLSISSWMT
jgi:hypothetical protein